MFSLPGHPNLHCVILQTAQLARPLLAGPLLPRPLLAACSFHRGRGRGDGDLGLRQQELDRYERGFVEISSARFKRSVYIFKTTPRDPTQ